MLLKSQEARMKTRDRPAIAATSRPDRIPTAGRSLADRSAITNDPSSRWSGRTANGRRARDLYRGYVTQLGGPTDPPTLALVVTAVERVLIAENARADYLAGKVISLEDIVRLERAADKALSRLKLDRMQAPKRKSLTEKLAEAEAAKAAGGPAT
jgi:hypothetical protein